MMPPSWRIEDEAMNFHQQQRWEFRRTGNDFDSSSSDSRSGLSGVPVVEKHKLVSLDNDDEPSDTSRLRPKANRNPLVGGEVKCAKAKKRSSGRSKKKGKLAHNEKSKDSLEGVNRKKRKIGTDDNAAAALDDLKKFMESLLKGLKVTRESLFMWMKEEMRKLAADDVDPSQEKVSRRRRPRREVDGAGEKVESQQHKKIFEHTIQETSRQIFEGDIAVNHHQSNFQGNGRAQEHQNNFEENVQKSVVLAIEAPNCGGGSSNRAAKGKKTVESSSHHQVSEVLFYNQDRGGSMLSNEKSRTETLGSFFEPTSSSNPYPQVELSPMFSTLPSVATEPCLTNNRFDNALSNYVQPRRGLVNDMSVNSGRGIQLLNPSALYGCFPGIQSDEQNQSFAQTESTSMNPFDQYSISTSSIGTGLTIPYHQDTNGTFNIPSQVGLQNLSQENNSSQGLRMDEGAIRFSRGSYTSAQHHAANYLHGHLNLQS